MPLLDTVPAHTKLFRTHVKGPRCSLPLLRSVQGYGRRSVAPNDGWIYPGSGATADSRPPVAHLAQEVVANGMLGAQTVVAGADDSSSYLNGVEEDAEAEFVGDDVERPPADGPRIINVGIPGPGTAKEHAVLTYFLAWLAFCGSVPLKTKC